MTSKSHVQIQIFEFQISNECIWFLCKYISTFYQTFLTQTYSLCSSNFTRHVSHIIWQCHLNCFLSHLGGLTKFPLSLLCPRESLFLSHVGILPGILKDAAVALSLTLLSGSAAGSAHPPRTSAFLLFSPSLFHIWNNNSRFLSWSSSSFVALTEKIVTMFLSTHFSSAKPVCFLSSLLQ